MEDTAVIVVNICVVDMVVVASVVPTSWASVVLSATKVVVSGDVSSNAVVYPSVDTSNVVVCAIVVKSISVVGSIMVVI